VLLALEGQAAPARWRDTFLAKREYPGGSKAFYWAVANVKWGLVSRSSRIAVYLIIFWPGAPIGNLSKFQNGPRAAGVFKILAVAR
jgi:hypothetical protein